MVLLLLLLIIINYYYRSLRSPPKRPRIRAAIVSLRSQGMNIINIYEVHVKLKIIVSEQKSNKIPLQHYCFINRQQQL